VNRDEPIAVEITCYGANISAGLELIIFAGADMTRGSQYVPLAVAALLGVRAVSM
jgi:hypothetical protein